LALRFWGGLSGLCAALAVSGCVTQNAQHQTTTFLDSYAEASPTLASFRECHGFACSSSSTVSLTQQEWSKVVAVMRPQAKDAKAERRKISVAVATMRMLVGAKTGTGVHQWTHKDRDILPNMSDPTQLDCIDESVNTWTYMTMMERGGLFRFHEVAKLSNATSLTGPRNTAVLKEKNGDYYAIDPSVVDAGVPPPVIPLQSWMTEWPPDLSKSDTPKTKVNVGGTRSASVESSKTAEAKAADAKPTPSQPAVVAIRDPAAE
jgi:hypothetical protein